MPMEEEKYFSTNADGSSNNTYCNYCYDKGAFIDGCNTLQEKMDSCIAMAIKSGMSPKIAEDIAKSILPPLKRWQP